MSKINSIKNQSELEIAMRISQGYMIAITLKEGDELSHYLLTKDFPKLDMLKSLKKSRDLIVENLEASENEVPATKEEKTDDQDT